MQVCTNFVHANGDKISFDWFLLRFVGIEKSSMMCKFLMFMCFKKFSMFGVDGCASEQLIYELLVIKEFHENPTRSKIP